MGMPGDHPEVTEVTVEHESLDDSTYLMMTDSGISAHSPGVMGWNMALDQLDVHLAASRFASDTDR